MNRAGLVLGVSLAMTSGACSVLPRQAVQKSVAPAPHEPWTPPAEARMPAEPDTAPPQLPEEYTMGAIGP